MWCLLPLYFTCISYIYTTSSRPSKATINTLIHIHGLSTDTGTDNTGRPPSSWNCELHRGLFLFHKISKKKNNNKKKKKLNQIHSFVLISYKLSNRFTYVFTMSHRLKSHFNLKEHLWGDIFAKKKWNFYSVCKILNIPTEACKGRYQNDYVNLGKS